MSARAATRPDNEFSQGLSGWFNRGHEFGTDRGVFDQFPIPITLGRGAYITESLSVIARITAIVGLFLLFMPAEMAEQWQELDMKNWLWIGTTAWMVIMLAVHAVWIFVVWNNQREGSQSLIIHKGKESATIEYNTRARKSMRTIAFLIRNTGTFALFRRLIDFMDIIFVSCIFIYIYARYPHWLFFPHFSLSSRPDQDRPGVARYQTLINGLFFSWLFSMMRIFLFYVLFPQIYAVRSFYNNYTSAWEIENHEAEVTTNNKNLVTRQDREETIYQHFPVPVTMGWYELTFVIFSNFFRALMLICIFALFFDPNVAKDWRRIRIPPWLWIILLVWNIFMFGKNFAWFTYMFRESSARSRGIQGSVRRQVFDRVAVYSERAQSAPRAAALINIPTGIIAFIHRVLVYTDLLVTTMTFVHFYPRYAILPLEHLDDEERADLEGAGGTSFTWPSSSPSLES